MAKFLKTTIVGGIVFLVPVVLMVLVIGKVLSLAGRLAQPMARLLNVDTAAGVIAANVIGLVLLALICFIAGLIARASFASRIIDRAEAKFLWNIPGYAQIKALIDTLDPGRDPSEAEAVLCRVGDHWQVGFVTERMTDGRVVVFLPGSPNPWSGSLWVLEADRIEALNASLVQAARCLRRLGHGSGDLLRPKTLVNLQTVGGPGAVKP